MRTLLPITLLAGTLLGGCGSGGDTGIPDKVSTEMTGLGDAARKAGGDYDKLSDADKQKFTERAGGEEGARAMVKQMTGAGGSRGPGGAGNK